MRATPKEKRYWQGIARTKSSSIEHKLDLKKKLEFLEEAYALVRQVKGRVRSNKPTEIEFYRKYQKLKAQHEK